MGNPSFNSPTSLEDAAQDQINSEKNAAELAEEVPTQFPIEPTPEGELKDAAE